jgi:hypothetical protein
LAESIELHIKALGWSEVEIEPEGKKSFSVLYGLPGQEPKSTIIPVSGWREAVKAIGKAPEEAIVAEKALERWDEGMSYIPVDEPTGVPEGTAFAATRVDMHIEGANARDAADAVAALGEPLVALPKREDDVSLLNSRNQLVVMSKSELLPLAGVHHIRGRAKMTKSELVEAIGNAYGFPKFEGIPDKVDVLCGMGEELMKMTPKPWQPTPTGPGDEILPDLAAFMPMGALQNTKVRIGRTTHLVRNDGGTVHIDGCLFELQGEVPVHSRGKPDSTKVVTFTQPGLVLQKWLGGLFRVRAIFSR